MSGECETCGEHVLDCKCGKKMGCDGSCTGCFGGINEDLLGPAENGFYMCNIHDNIGKEMGKIRYNEMGFVRTDDDAWVNLDHIREVGVSQYVKEYYVDLIDINYNSYKIAGPFDASITAIRVMDEFMENMGNEKKSRMTPEKPPKKAKKTPEKEPILPSEWGKVDSMIPASPFLPTKTKKAKKKND